MHFCTETFADPSGAKMFFLMVPKRLLLFIVTGTLIIFDCSCFLVIIFSPPINPLLLLLPLLQSIFRGVTRLGSLDQVTVLMWRVEVWTYSTTSGHDLPWLWLYDSQRSHGRRDPLMFIIESHK